MQINWQREPVPPAEFTLTLSEDEALELMGTLGHVTGTQQVAGEVFDALDEALAAARGDNFTTRSDTPAFKRGEDQPLSGCRS